MWYKNNWITLIAVLAISALVMAACPAPEAPPVVEEPVEPEPIAETELEIFSWWTNPGEAEGLAALFELYNERWADVEIINATVAGGAGVDAKAVLTTRMLGGDPPDSFQVHVGEELIDNWVVTDMMEPITWLYEEEGWFDVFSPEILELATYEGEIYSVPVNVHRSNVMWYNIAIFEEHGLEPPTTFDEFFAVAEALQEAGVTPLAMGTADRFAMAHLYETVLLGALGAEDYNGLWDGSTSWTGDEVREATEIFGMMLDYINRDHPALSWADAAALVRDGEAAMYVMGDWAHGFLTQTGAVPGEDYGFMASPNTDGMFQVVSDSFGLPQAAPHRENAINWLRVLGTREGQDAFNPLKGSIPARLDPDRDLYDVYQQTALDSFAQDAHAPSVVHGSAAPDAFAGSEFLILALDFEVERDIDEFLNSVQQLAEDTYLAR